MSPVWILYIFVIALSFTLVGVTYVRAKHHLKQYPLFHTEGHSVFGYTFQKFLFPLYFLMLLVAAMIFGFFFHHFL